MLIWEYLILHFSMPNLIWNDKKTHMINAYQQFQQNGEHLFNPTLAPRVYNTHYYSNTKRATIIFLYSATKTQSRNGTEIYTQMILTLNGKQYAPKYVILFLLHYDPFISTSHKEDYHVTINYINWKLHTGYCRFCNNAPETLCIYSGNVLMCRNYKNNWDLISIFTAESIDTEMSSVMSCIYSKENQIYT